MSQAPSQATTNQSPGSAPRRKKKGSMYSLASSARRARPMAKEEQIGKKINDLFRDKEQKMIRTIEVAIFDDNHRVYTGFRKEFADKIEDLEKERAKILRRKKNKKEKMKLLKTNSKDKFKFITTALNNTVKYYKKLYFENDYYRQKRLMEIDEVKEVDEEELKVQKLGQIQGFFNSPFKEDKRFAITYIAQLTRDKLQIFSIVQNFFRQDSEQIVNEIFFDKIFTLLLETDDERNKLKSFEILCNLIHSDEQRLKMAKENYFQRVYEWFDSQKLDNRTMEKLSWMTTLICFYPDMIEQIIELNLLDFIIKISSHKYPSNIRSNAVLALSLLTYHEKMFDELIKRGVIDLVMDLCKDGNGDIQVKQFSTLALVHFALNKHSISILIEKGVMDLFNSFASIDNGIIQTNVSWIFLALCNNGITGKTMLENGITRDMFLVSCNPQFNQIRHLVIAGFAELGRCTELKDVDDKQLTAEFQKIKETAIVGMHKNFKLEADKTIEILLKFTVSEHEMFKIISYWALKDYILLNHDSLIQDLNGVIQTFVNGCIYPQEEVNTECANAISFLITHHLVYVDKAISDQEPSNYILDALMHLTGSSSKFIRTRAFSTLSTLSTYASASEHIMEQIYRDIKLPQNKASKQYYDFITARLEANLNQFDQNYKTPFIEGKYAGLYCLLRIAKDPKEEVVQEAAEKLYDFIFSNNDIKDELNEVFFIYVFHSLKFSKNHQILLKILKVIKFYIKYQSAMQKEVINPDTILWLLEILEQHRSNKLLGCKAARTLLSIVSEHQIVFDYQEVAIIKKFNLALQNLDVFDSQQDQLEEDPEILSQLISSQNLNPKDQSANQSVHQVDKVSIQNKKGDGVSQQSSIEHPINFDQLEQQMNQILNKDDEKISQVHSKKTINHTKENLEEQKSTITQKIQEQKVEVIDVDTNQINQEIQILSNDQELQQQFDHDLDKKSNKSQNIEHSQLKMQDNRSEKSLKSQQNQKLEELEAQSNHELQKHQSIHQKEYISQTPSKQDGLSLSNHQMKEINMNSSRISLNQSISQKSSVKKNPLAGIMLPQKSKENKSSLSKMQTLRDSLSKTNSAAQKLKRARVTGQTNQTNQSEINAVIITEQQDDDESNKFSDKLREELDSDDESDFSDLENDVLDSILRDSLIKSFMVIFTHDHSQHLLLNKDLIDIAFNCLEFCSEISIEAKQKLARLISIIFKFPQVQERMLSHDVIIGIKHLLEQVDEFDIVKNTVKACTYLSMNYEFVSSKLSLEVLKNLVPLLYNFSGNDKQNLIYSISNILKGDNENKMYFFENSGSQYFLKLILESNDEKVIELCISSIKELASYKSTIQGMIIKEEESLKRAFIKCLEITESWRDNQITHIKVIKQSRMNLIEAMEGKQTMPIQSQYNSAIEQEGIQSMHSGTQQSPTRGIKDHNLMQKLIKNEGDEKKSSLFASSAVLIRNHTYYIISKSIKRGISAKFLRDQCQLLDRIVKDLKDYEENWFLFENLLIALNSFEKEPNLIYEFLNSRHTEIFDLIQKYPNQDNRISILKVIINLILRAIEMLSKNGTLFNDLFAMIETSQDDEVKENIIWLASSMLETSQSNNVIQIFLSNNIIEILANQLSVDNCIKNIQQTLITLKTISKVPQLIERFTKLPLYDNIQLLLSSEKCYNNLEIKTSLMELLAQCSLDKNQSSQEMINRDYISSLLNQLKENKYLLDTQFADQNFMDFGDDDQDYSKLLKNDKISDERLIKMAEQLNLKYLTAGGLDALDINFFDEIEKQPNSNCMIEATMETLANLSQKLEAQNQMIQLGILDYIKQLLSIFQPFSYQQFNQINADANSIDLNTLSLGNLDILKNMSAIVLNFTGNYELQDTLIKREIVQIMRHFTLLNDYEVLTNIYLAFGNLLLSKNDYIRRRSVELGCLDHLLEINETTQYLRIKRICNQTLQKCDSQLFEYNDQIKSRQ